MNIDEQYFPKDFLFTPSQAAEYLEVSPSQISKWLIAGRLYKEQDGLVKGIRFGDLYEWKRKRTRRTS